MQSNWMEQHQCANPPQSEGSGAGSIWSGDGTSATESSCNEKAATANPSIAQERQHGTPHRSAVADEAASTKLRLLLVGDSNISGYCETQPCDAIQYQASAGQTLQTAPMHCMPKTQKHKIWM